MESMLTRRFRRGPTDFFVQQMPGENLHMYVCACAICVHILSLVG